MATCGHLCVHCSKAGMTRFYSTYKTLQVRWLSGSIPLLRFAKPCLWLQRMLSSALLSHILFAFEFYDVPHVGCTLTMRNEKEF